MKIITIETINRFKNYLVSEEKSQSTLEKYIRDMTAFMVWLNGRVVDKMTVIEYKQSIMELYAPANDRLSKGNTT